VHVTNCHVQDNVSPGIRDGSGAGLKTKNVVIAGNIVPKSAITGRQTQSIIGIGEAGKKAVVANNILLGYGSGSLGATLDSTVIEQNNVTDP
jgi:hypothetical protein